MRKILLIMSLLPAMAIANPNMHHQPHGEFGKPPMHRFIYDGEHLPPFLHDIDLTEQQQTEIKALIKAQHAEMSEKWEQEKGVKSELHQLSFSSNYTEDTALALIERSLVTHKEMALQKTKLNNAIFKLLSVEQQNKLKNAPEKVEH